MNRFVVGLVLGVILTLATIVADGNWYRYLIVEDRSNVTDLVNNDGWEIVPGQTNGFYLRHPRLSWHN